MNNPTNANGANFDPYLSWLGIRDPQRPPNHYRLLGLETFESDADVISAAADRQMTYVRTYQAGQHGEHSQRILNELTTAKLCLLKPERKRDYDERIRAAQKPAAAPPPPQAPPQARPFAAPPQALQPQPMYPAGVAPRPVMARPIPQAAPAAMNDQNAAGPFGGSVVRGPATRPAGNSAVMQWSIVGGLVLVTTILAVILANKYSGGDAQPIAQNPPSAKVTPTSTKNAKPNPAPAVIPAETNPPTEPAPETPGPKTPAVTKPPQNPDEQRPGPVKAPLPNIPLPGIEEPTPPAATTQTPAPMNPASISPAPTNPAPAVTPSAPATPAMPATPMAVATNNDPLNSLPLSVGSNPTEPQPANPAPANPLASPTAPANPLTEPLNPLAMPNPLEGNPLTAPPPKPPRRPLPTAKEIAENRANIREVYKNEYASREPNVLSGLSKQLLRAAHESADKPAMMYTAFEEVRNVCAQINDVETLFAVHEEMTREFAVDRDKDLLDTLKFAAKAAPTMNAEHAGSVLDVIQETVATAILEQRLDTAEQMLKYVSNFSGRVPDKAAREIGFRDLLKKLGEHKAFAAKAKEYKDTLARNPNDGEANLELGKFWAFQQGNFEQGLSYLAKGSDSEIREAANRELTIKPDAPEYVKVADAWWEVANKLPTDPRATVKIHAAYQYARALSSLKALDRGLAESRINEAYKSFKPNNREVKELIKLLLTRTNWKMEWKGNGPKDPTIGFELTGSSTADDYRTWKLMDNYLVVVFRERDDRPGPPGFGGFSGFKGKGRPRGPGGNNNGNNDNANTKGPDTTKNVLQIAVSANRIDIRVLGNEGELRGTGTGIPD